MSKLSVTRKDSVGLLAALHIVGVKLRLNSRAGRPEIQGLAGDRWTDLTDYSEAKLRETFRDKVLLKHKALVWGERDWHNTLLAYLYSHQHDPFIDWLKEQEAGYDPEAKPVLDTFLMDMFGIEDNPLNRWISRVMALGPIHRAFKPGCKLDHTPVLVAQAGGEGKSALTKELIDYSRNPEWHTDALTLDSEPKVQVEALSGRVLVELAEMQGATRAELGRLKAFLTRTDDGAIRLAYRRYAERALRMCFFIGTENKEQCLPNDQAALRRFVPVTLAKGCNVEAYMREHRQQIWGEAMTLYMATPEDERDALVQISGNPADPLNMAQRERAEEYRANDEVMEARVDKFIMPMLKRRYVEKGATLEELMRDCALPDSQISNRGMQARFCKALTASGWTKRKLMVNKSRHWRWFPPA